MYDHLLQYPTEAKARDVWPCDDLNVPSWLVNGYSVMPVKVYLTAELQAPGYWIAISGLEYRTRDTFGPEWQLTAYRPTGVVTDSKLKASTISALYGISPVPAGADYRFKRDAEAVSVDPGAP